MSNKKYWLDMVIQTRDSTSPRCGSYRTTAPMVLVMRKHIVIRHRKTVDILKLVIEAVDKMVGLLESKTGGRDGENQLR